MNPLFERLEVEQKHTSAIPGNDAGSARHDFLEPQRSLMGNIREWLGDGERKGLLRISQTPVRLQDERSGSFEAEGLGVDFGCGRRLEVKPTGPDSHGRVEMNFHGCRRVGRILLQRRGEQWLIWPKNSVRQQPMPWNSRIFLDLLNDMV